LLNAASSVATKPAETSLANGIMYRKYSFILKAKKKGKFIPLTGRGYP
jgi:hypothetical protein